MGQKSEGFHKQLAFRKAVKKVEFLVKKLVFATKGLKEEAFLDYFATKLHIFMKKLVFATKELKKRPSWIIQSLRAFRRAV